MISEEELKKRGFTKITLNRKGHYRHDIATGEFFDSYRNQILQNKDIVGITEAIKEDLIEAEFDVEGDIKDLDENCRVIVAKHKVANKINKVIKDLYQKKGITLFPCKLVRKTKELPKGSRLLIPLDSEEIFWDRLSYKDEVPKNKKYEPAYCTTCYSMQGSEVKNELLYIDTSCKDPRYIYTAITRVSSLEQIRFF